MNRQEPIGWILAGAIVAAGYIALLMSLMPAPDQRSSAFCDRIFAEFMTTKDPVVVNRNGWLLDGMNCSISRRYRKTQP